ncbi:hypothetical protein [Streptomyces sp. KR80]|uniref:hypothetical protein n=1 Tax=Streptomyces sp. KR80 TaxID=3457426 RepID=UPI003FD475E5
MDTALLIMMLPLPVLAIFTVVYARQLRSKLRTARAGLVATGHCVRVYFTQSGPGVSNYGPPKRNYVFGFTTQSGQWVEFEEAVAHQEEGAPVQVRYQRDDPRGTATVSGSHGSSIVFDVIAVVGFGFFTLLLAVGLLLALT